MKDKFLVKTYPILNICRVHLILICQLMILVVDRNSGGWLQDHYNGFQGFGVH